MKGYKAYQRGLICEPDGNKKQYKENTVYEENEAIVCHSGMHFCANPLDVLYYYPLIDDDGHFSDITTVESLDDAKTNDNRKFCTKKLKIGVKLELPAFIKAAIDFVLEKNPTNHNSQLASSGYNSKLASSGYNSKLASSGDYSKLASSGDNSKLASSGYNSQFASSGDNSQLASSGYNSQLASSGYNSKLASSGYNSQLASSGDNSKLASSGDNSQLASSGDNSQLASSGDNSKLASSGYNSQFASSGDNSKLASSGDYSKLASSGDYSKLASSGDYSVVAGIGIDNIAKARKGSWITLAEWKYDVNKNKYIPVCVKSEQVDGKKIKEDTFYKLENGEFVEVE